MGVRSVDFAPIPAASPDHWLFVDRIHFADDGHGFA